jgi:hypothetical protein
VPSRDRHLLLSLAAVATLWLLVAAVAGVDSGLLHFLPLFGLFVPLLRGRYIGEEALHRLREGRHSAPLPRPIRRAALPATSFGRVHVVAGGEVLARHIAVRPPPLAASY